MTASIEPIPVPPTVEDPTDGRGRFRWRPILEAGVPLAALVLLVVATAICEHVKNGTDYFLTPDNLLNVLLAQSPVGVLAVGMTFVIIAGGIDLSVGSMVAMAGCLGLLAMRRVAGPGNVEAGHGGAVLLGVGVVVAVGLVAGLVNGLLIAKGRLAPFIATLGGLAAYRSVAKTLAEGSTVNFSNNRGLLSLGGAGGIPLPFLRVPDGAATLYWPVVVFAVLAAVAGVVLNKTRYGRYIVALGGNERAAAYSAVNVPRVKLLTYVLMGGAAGVAAVLAVARQASVSSTQTGQLYELDAIAAVVIGGTRMSGGSGTLFGTVVGVLILGVINNMLGILDVSPYLDGIVKGGIIVVAVLVQRLGGGGRRA